MPTFSGKPADVFGKTWACFFSSTRHVFFTHWKAYISIHRLGALLLLVGTVYISIHRLDALLLLVSKAQKKARKSHDFRTPICKNTKYYSYDSFTSQPSALAPNTAASASFN